MPRQLQIDKLLETVVREKISDLHITVGQPPVVRSGGRMVRLETKSLEKEDTAALMKSITPERNQQQLQERIQEDRVLRKRGPTVGSLAGATLDGATDGGTE